MATLTINAGSSSLKFGIFEGLDARIRGSVSGLGGQARLSYARTGRDKTKEDLDGNDMDAALGRVLAVAEASGLPIDRIGHRIVHGGLAFNKPTVLDASVMTALDDLGPLAPLHQPANLDCVRATMRAFPAARQIGCFDTAFHRKQPFTSDTFGLPYAYFEEGVRRYGFHGLSYEYIAGFLKRTYPERADGKTVVLHLGSGASACALDRGRSIATTMGFSALDGLVMGTRCGQIDPGVLLWLMAEKGMDAAAITDLLYRRSGLLGLSGISNDMRDLEASSDARAQQAVDYFVARIHHEVGGLAAALRGIDALVFCGGIGENSSTIRSAVVGGLAWLGAEMNEEANRSGARDLSASSSKVAILRIETDEEAMIAEHVATLGA